MNKVIHTDICVIGAGSGGLSVAAGAVQMGAKVVLIENAEIAASFREQFRGLWQAAKVPGVTGKT